MEMEGKEMFGVGDFKDVYKQLVANPKVEIVACKPDGHWMRYTGKAVFDTDPKYEAAGLEVMPNLKDIYNEKTGEFINTSEPKTQRPASTPPRPASSPSTSGSRSGSDSSFLGGCLGALGVLVLQILPYAIIGGLVSLCS